MSLGSPKRKIGAVSRPAREARESVEELFGLDGPENDAEGELGVDFGPDGSEDDEEEEPSPKDPSAGEGLGGGKAKKVRKEMASRHREMRRYRAMRKHGRQAEYQFGLIPFKEETKECPDMAALEKAGWALPRRENPAEFSLSSIAPGLPLSVGWELVGGPGIYVVPVRGSSGFVPTELEALPATPGTTAYMYGRTRKNFSERSPLVVSEGKIYHAVNLQVVGTAVTWGKSGRAGWVAPRDSLGRVQGKRGEIGLRIGVGRFPIPLERRDDPAIPREVGNFAKAAKNFGVCLPSGLSPSPAPALKSTVRMGDLVRIANRNFTGKEHLHKEVERVAPDIQANPQGENIPGGVALVVVGMLHGVYSRSKTLKAMFDFGGTPWGDVVSCLGVCTSPAKTPTLQRSSIETLCIAMTSPVVGLCAEMILVSLGLPICNVRTLEMAAYHAQRMHSNDPSPRSLAKLIAESPGLASVASSAVEDGYTYPETADWLHSASCSGCVDLIRAVQKKLGSRGTVLVNSVERPVQ